MEDRIKEDGRSLMGEGCDKAGRAVARVGGGWQWELGGTAKARACNNNEKDDGVIKVLEV